MEAVWIRPEDINASSEYTADWIMFIKKFGYVDDGGSPWRAVLLVEIKIKD